MDGKGSLLGYADVSIVKWRLIIKGVGIFQKGAARWVKMPQREFQKSDGSTGYSDIMSFSDKNVITRFRKAVFSALESAGHIAPKEKGKRITYQPTYRPADFPPVTNDDIIY
jgi:DNA-binding cell septation regulator SpoVG